MSGRQTMQWTIPASLERLEILSEAIADLYEDIEADDLENLIYVSQFAVHELCVNIIEHAYRKKGGTIHLKLSVEPGLFSAEITDKGREFKPNKVATPAFGTLQERGFGVFLIKELMDTVEYKRRLGKNHWKLEKKF